MCVWVREGVRVCMQGTSNTWSQLLKLELKCKLSAYGIILSISISLPGKAVEVHAEDLSQAQG